MVQIADALVHSDVLLAIYNPKKKHMLSEEHVHKTHSIDCQSSDAQRLQVVVPCRVSGTDK